MNSIGERIYELRKKNNMSQGDLADMLDVSRQTISKWENNSSVPEIGKLIQLSEIFGVTTDHILKEQKQQPDLKNEKDQSGTVYVYIKDTDSKNDYKHSETIVKKYVGIVLAVIFSLITVFMIIVGGQFFAIPTGAVAVLGILLACNAKHPWLVTSWIAYVVSAAAFPFYTSISPFLIFDPIIYTEGHLAEFSFAYAEWIALFVLITCTVKIKRGYIFKKNDTE